MSIIILTPPPKKPAASTTEPAADAVAAPSATTESVGQRLESGFLHLIGLEGHHFADWAAVRDFAQAQIDATKPAESAAEAPPAPQA